MKQPKNTTTVRGIVTPWEWDRDDLVTAVVISTAREEDFVVRDASMVERLSQHVDDVVEVTGVAGTDEDGERSIVPSSMLLVGGVWGDERDDEDDDDDWDDADDDWDDDDDDSGW